MNRFLVEDLLTEANPRASPHRTPVSQETLLDAIRHAEPKIDSRFDRAPEIAAEVHEALGNAFGALNSYDEPIANIELLRSVFARSKALYLRNRSRSNCVTSFCSTSNKRRRRLPRLDRP